jgi:hypothetical protein
MFIFMLRPDPFIFVGSGDNVHDYQDAKIHDPYPAYNLNHFKDNTKYAPGSQIFGTHGKDPSDYQHGKSNNY